MWEAIFGAGTITGPMAIAISIINLLLLVALFFIRAFLKSLKGDIGKLFDKNEKHETRISFLEGKLNGKEN